VRASCARALGRVQIALGSSGCAPMGCRLTCDQSAESAHAMSNSSERAREGSPLCKIYIFRGLLVQGHATRQSLYDHAVSLEHAVPRTNSAMCLQEEAGDIELLSVYVPTNHIYIGDIFLLQRADVIRTSLSVREGLGKAPLCLVGVSSMRLRLVCERAVLLQRNASLQHCVSTQQSASCHAAHLCQTYMVACCVKLPLCVVLFICTCRCSGGWGRSSQDTCAGRRGAGKRWRRLACAVEVATQAGVPAAVPAHSVCFLLRVSGKLHRSAA